MLRKPSRRASAEILCVTRNRAACSSRRDDGILCILRVTGAQPNMATAAQGSRPPSQSGAFQRGRKGLSANWGSANLNLCACCFFCRSFPSASSCITTLSFTFTRETARILIPPMSIAAGCPRQADERPRRPGSEPHERSIGPDTACPKRRDACAFNTVSSPRLACLLSFFCFRPQFRPPAGTGLSCARRQFVNRSRLWWSWLNSLRHVEDPQR